MMFAEALDSTPPGETATEMRASVPKYFQGEIYPSTKRRKPVGFVESKITAVSGTFEGKFFQKRIGQATLDLKIDVDRLKEFSPTLNIISGTVVKSKGDFLRIGRHTALYFRSFDGSLKVNTPEERTREIAGDVIITRNDGERFHGIVEIQLRLTEDQQDWQGLCKIQLQDETVTFECIRKSLHFRKMAIDIDYVDEVVWPTLTLGEYFDMPHHLKGRKIDPLTVFDDAGVKLMYDARDSNKIIDPTPNTPWTKNDMYELMMANLDRREGDHDTVWAMMALEPPDYRYMGYSFDRKGRHGFGLFINHKSFEGLREVSHENHIYAKRRFLHYFIHECGHALGLHHPFEQGRPHELTWMNYAWRYDDINGPGKFYSRFNYSFTGTELRVIRHSPHKHFMAARTSDFRIFSYGIIKAVPGEFHSEEFEEEEKEVGISDVNISLRIKIRNEPFQMNELVEVEVRIKNEGMVPSVVERDLSIENGYLNMFVTCPDGKVMKTKSFVRSISGTQYSKPLLLYPGDNGMDRHTQLISLGEGDYGANFNTQGKYHLQAVYCAGETKVLSNKASLTLVESKMKGLEEENVALTLGSISHSHTKHLQKWWRKIVGLKVVDRKLFLSKIISIAEEVAAKQVRVVITNRSGMKSIKNEASVITHQEFLSGTEEMFNYFHAQGVVGDNLMYKELVMARVKVHMKVNKENGSREFGIMVADLIARGVKFAAIKSIMQELEEVKQPEKDPIIKDAAYYQKRVEDILDWFPDRIVEKKEDISGVGLGVTLNHFEGDHVFSTSKIVRLLFNKLDETHNLDRVFDYADNLQKSYKVNHLVLHWAVEIFIIHSSEAKKSGIMYPLPPDRDLTAETSAAMVAIDRSGTPRENWMDYWRSDGDLNYHHRHWHSVYVVGREIGRRIDWFGPWRNARPELERQGELFVYMHQQMLARYDCERRSWGLNYAQEWRYEDRDALGYNAGFEYHNHRSNFDVSPRPPASWPVRDQRQFRDWEESYRTAVENGVLPSVFVAGRNQPLNFRMDFNLSGHVLEASSSTWQRFMGSIHNQGHGVFGSNRVQGGSYMLSTVSAMRDPIFYRWHKRIDNLWQLWNNTQITELASDAPTVRIRSSDILMRKSRDELNGFASFQSDTFESEEMTTFLGPPMKRFERDNKISHDPFFYHIRFRRTSPGDLNLTFRLFIVPEREVNNRQMYIEMDKFVYRMPSNQETGVIVRPDFHSSVIKRNPEEMEGNVEAQTTNIVTGFCECGWPYSMLLPRGTAEGETWRVCVFVSDNNLDEIAVRSSCGSLSFCGASGQQYPDTRPMGYPFTTAVSINGEETRITNAVDYLDNAAMSSFVIKNNVVTTTETSLVDIWSAWVQLNQSDGTIDNNETIFSSSTIVGRMRVLIDEESLNLNRSGRISIRFQGRGSGNGTYRVANAAVTLREGTSLNIMRGSEASFLTVQGQNSFDVPEYGLVTDEVAISAQARDLFITFTLLTPGSFLRGARGESTSTWVLLEPSGEGATSHNWNNLENVRVSPSIYCVGGVMSPVPR